VPEIRQRYLAHLRTIINDGLNQTEVNSFIDRNYNLINQIVQNDTKKLYTTTQFQNGIQGLKDFVNQRRNVLFSNVEVNFQGLAISDLSYTAGGIVFGKPTKGAQVPVTVKVAGAAGVNKVNLYYGTGLVGMFERLQMFDDGKHNDLASGDGIFGANIPGFQSGTWVRFYVEAIANNTLKTATYYPEGAEHDVFIYQVKFENLQESAVVINEFMASNTKTVADQDGEYDDWIELFNKSTQAVNISSWFMSDDASKLTKWTFPAGTIIGPGEYLIVWADENGSQKGLHANFKLSAGGEELFLLDTLQRIVQQIQFGQQQPDMGYARMPNGSGNFVVQKATFKQNNDLAVDAKEEFLTSSSFKLFPNPVFDMLTIRSNTENPETFELFNLYGRKILNHQFVKEVSVDVSHLVAGIYFITNGRNVEKLIIQRR
jgi:hypothetical protein